MKIAAVTIQDDLHAHIIRQALRSRHGIEMKLIEVDRISAKNHIDWNFSGTSPVCRVKCDGEWVSLNELRAVWWRRSRAHQLFDGITYPQEQEDVINNDCRSAFAGALLSCFEGFWLSHPHATERAGNKLVQLKAATKCGFRVPRTLVSQDPDSVASFVAALPSKRAIVKTVAGGGRGLFLFTQFVTEEELEKAESIRVCPAIYQEFIDGDTHIRLNCFGTQSYAGKIVSSELDWRPNLNVPVAAWKVPDELHKKVRSVLDELAIEMGVVDLKVTPEGEYVWLEVNPQGQFLFLEPMTGTRYSVIFSDFLAESASTVSS